MPELIHKPRRKDMADLLKAPHRIIQAEGISYRAWDAAEVTKRFNQPDPTRGYRSTNTQK